VDETFNNQEAQPFGLSLDVCWLPRSLGFASSAVSLRQLFYGKRSNLASLRTYSFIQSTKYDFFNDFLCSS
jgi:hypothetical protein